MKDKKIFSFVLSFALFAFVFLGVNSASAHCDTMDGPVIVAAEEALKTGNPNLILIWVKDEDDQVIREAFEKAVKIRKLSPEAKEFADMYFFETLVRIHRAGEGAPYTGIKPAGTDIGEVVPAVDMAFETGSADPFLKFLPEGLHSAARSHFNQIYSKKNFDPNDVAAGRSYVGSYVEFMHHILELSGSPETEEHKHGSSEESGESTCQTAVNNPDNEEKLNEKIGDLERNLIIAWSSAVLSFILLLILLAKNIRK